MEFESFDVGGLSSELRGLRAEFDAATSASGRLGKEAKNAFAGIAREGHRASKMGQDLHRALGSAFDDLVVGGRSFQDVLKSLAVDLAKLAAQDIFGTGVGGGQSGGAGALLGDLFGSILTPNAKGNVFDQGRIHAFAKGGVLSNPALFPMQGGVGLAGEAGAEAILPLARGQMENSAWRRRAAGKPSTLLSMSLPLMRRASSAAKARSPPCFSARSVAAIAIFRIGAYLWHFMKSDFRWKLLLALPVGRSGAPKL